MLPEALMPPAARFSWPLARQFWACQLVWVLPFASLVVISFSTKSLLVATLAPAAKKLPVALVLRPIDAPDAALMA